MRRRECPSALWVCCLVRCLVTLGLGAWPGRVPVAASKTQSHCVGLGLLLSLRSKLPYAPALALPRFLVAAAAAVVAAAAAATAVVAAAAAAVVAAAAAPAVVAAAAANQEDQDDDPPAAPTETTIVTTTHDFVTSL